MYVYTVFLFIKGFNFFIKANILKNVWISPQICSTHKCPPSCFLLCSCKETEVSSVCGYVCKYGSTCACMWNVECSLNICIYLYNCLWEFDFIVFFTLSICRNRCSATCRVNFLLYHCWPDVQFFGDLVAVTEYSIKKKRKSKLNGF